MKKRLGFVSNSSSSSFVVIDDSYSYMDFPLDKEKYGDENEWDSTTLYVYPEMAQETQFGWQIDEYNDIFSKVFWAYLQAESSSAKGHYMDMLEESLKEAYAVESVEWKINEDSYNIYIDHESLQQYEIFDDLCTLKNFLFNENSEIHTDNDNH